MRELSKAEHQRDVLFATTVPFAVLVGTFIAFVLGSVVPREVVVPVQMALVGGVCALIGSRLPHAVREGASRRAGAVLGAAIGVAATVVVHLVLIAML